MAEAIQTLAKNISEALIDIGTGKSKTITKTPLGKVQISLRPEIEDVLTIIDAKAPDNQIKAAPFGKILVHAILVLKHLKPISANKSISCL